MSNIKQAKEIVSKELSLPASKLVGGTVANNSGTLEGTDLQLMYSEGYVNGTAKNTSEVLAGTTTIAPTWVDGTNYVKKVKDGSWVAVENAPMFGTLPDFYTGREAYSNGKWYGEGSIGSTVDSHDPFSDGSGVALYELDVDATDVSGNYDGDASNVTYDTGEFGQCAVFNGSSSNIDIVVDVSTTYSYSMWAKADTVHRGTVMLVGSADDADGKYRAVVDFLDTGDLRLYGRDSAGTNFQEITTPYTTGTWYHIVVVLNPTTYDFYVDNILIGSNSYDGPRDMSYDFIHLGRMQSSGNFNSVHLDGSIDQVRIFNRALTSTEVTALHNEELPLFTELPPQTYLPYTVEATGGNVIAVNEWKYPDLVTDYVTTNDLHVTNEIVVTGLPISDPLIEGMLWSSAGTLKISAGA